MALMGCHPYQVLRTVISIIQSDICSYIFYLYSEISRFYTHTNRLWLPHIVAIIFACFKVQGVYRSNRENGRLLSRCQRSFFVGECINEYVKQMLVISGASTTKIKKKSMIQIRRINRKSTFLASFSVHRFPEQTFVMTNTRPFYSSLIQEAGCFRI